MTEFLGTASATTKVILGIKGVTIDNLTFQLHYKVTTAILMIGAALTTSKQFLGDPIACEVVKNMAPYKYLTANLYMILTCSIIGLKCKYSIFQPGGGVNEGTLQAYCWMYSQFTLPGDFKGKCVKREHDGTNLYNSYYQWVALFLVASALLFYVPRALWLTFEGGLMSFLSKGATKKVSRCYLLYSNIVQSCE